MNVKEEILLLQKTAELPEVRTVPLGEEMQELAIDARNVLGYDLLHAASLSRKVLSLAQVLRDLGIEVLPFDAVLAYQRKIGTPTNKLLRLVESSSAPDFDDDEEDDEDEEMEEQVSMREWVSTDIKKYTLPIPAHVLLKAVEIKKALPTVEFSVESVRKVPDPFLIASLREEFYYIEVWEEPKFEGRSEPTQKHTHRSKKSRG